ncbi:WLM domain-containing protein [Pseudomassariella vexata]|uniref:WLM domain-domain-containing protein n=1 Tax=Pseudomassariella vexata TaxID=1141098 RepID=A0A1Y2E3F8_9PEZI|nr:WLM domain-containing protein [Pseudomassariella vexata]ORY65967.1 WLM domain-domain-containing protein [Pseudomassariella vexata]
MPVGIQRINAKKSQPNSLIIFIKPLKGPDEAIAQDFLERIAAQCLPIMREHRLSVMTLEEYEPNREFVGRNFNAGEVIQLVLKSPATGRWLPFNYVQMVMMHELAHCKQMNHSKAFWAERNNYAEQMRTLWTRGYTGEGIWGRGANLATGAFEANTVEPGEVLPDHLCGGTYRSRRKRKAKDQLSYKERKQRRILKKFGANGVALGEDEDVKAELEKGRRTQAKPRVAGSKRGRELRAAAALARFDQRKTPYDEKKSTPFDDDETTSEEESETASGSEKEDVFAVDMNGKRLLDDKGRRMVKVCEVENAEDLDAQSELRELQSSMTPRKVPGLGSALLSSKTPAATQKPEKAELLSQPPSTTSSKKQETSRQDTKKSAQAGLDEKSKAQAQGQIAPVREQLATTGVCPLCSFDNGPDPMTCVICSHVLDSRKVLNSWRCKSAACQGSLYLNAGDTGLCGVCGARKSGGS